MKKSLVLFLFGVAVFVILKRYYKQGNTGLPNPKALAGPTYLYGILALTSDFTGGFTVPIAAGLTLALIWQTNALAAAEKTQKAAAKPPKQSVAQLPKKYQPTPTWPLAK